MSTNALSQLLGREYPIRLHNSLLGMHPLGLKRIEPGPSPGEQERQDTHALAGLFDVLIVLTNPIAHHFTDMPGSIIPDQKPVPFSLGCQAFTTNLLVDVARLRAGESVLIHAAAGGVGITAAQIARHLEAGQIIGTVGSQEKMTYARSFGYDQVVLRENFVQAVQELTNGRGVDIILDAAGEPTRSQGLTVLAPFGRLVNFGNASGQPEVPFPLENLRATNKSVMGYSFHGLSSSAPQMLTETARKAFQLLASGQIRVDITKILPMEQAAEAHRLLESGAPTGKLLLSI